MKKMLTLILLAALSSLAAEREIEIELTATKDMFARSNKLNRNNGASSYLLLSGGSNIKSLIGFNLAPVTNEIIRAELHVCIQNINEVPLTLNVAHMVHNSANTSWREGAGNLGIVGTNARVGDATFAWRSFRDQPWQSDSGDPLRSLIDSNLWKRPFAILSNVEWVEGRWIHIPLNNVGMLETIRISEAPVVTFGLWGSSGNGTYTLHARESGNAPKLKLVVKEKE